MITLRDKYSDGNGIGDNKTNSKRKPVTGIERTVVVDNSAENPELKERLTKENFKEFTGYSARKYPNFPYAGYIWKDGKKIDIDQNTARLMGYQDGGKTDLSLKQVAPKKQLMPIVSKPNAIQKEQQTYMGKTAPNYSNIVKNIKNARELSPEEIRQNRIRTIKNNPSAWNIKDYTQNKIAEPGIEEVDNPILDLVGLAELKAIGKVAKPLVKGTAKSLKSLKQEILYRGINPVGYGARQKIDEFPSNLINYTFNPERKIQDIGLQLKGFSDGTSKSLKESRIKLKNSLNLTQQEYDNLSLKDYTNFYSPKDVEKIISSGKNRSDSWRLGLGLEQKHNTFDKIGDDLYRINPEKFNPTKENLVMLDNDIKVSKEPRYFYGEGEDPKVLLTKKYNKVRNQSFLNYPEYNLGKEVQPWTQTRAVEKSRNPDFENSVYDGDHNGIMGQFRWDVKNTPEGNLHYQSNDTWDLHPWQKRGSINKGAAGSGYDRKFLKNVEVLKLLGGKPFNIQNNFIVDPKDFSVLNKYKDGGKINKK